MKKLAFLLLTLALVFPTARAEYVTDREGNFYYNPETESTAPRTFMSSYAETDEVESGGLRYQLLDDNTLGVTGYTSEVPAELTIPATVTLDDGVTYQVSSIERSAFLACQTLTSVVVSEGITTIGSFAFENCSNLETVQLPASLTSFGYNTEYDYNEGQVFYGCVSLKSIEVNNNNTLFQSKDGVLCTGNTLLQYPLGKTATEYTVPEGITEIGAYAFAYPESYTDDDSTLPHKVNLQGVEIIGNGAFYAARGLQEVDFGNVLREIQGAFFACDLRTISLPATLEVLDDNFEYCENLESINVAEGCTNYWSYDGVLYGNVFDYSQGEKKTLIRYPSKKEGTSYSILNGTEAIGNSSFSGATQLESLGIPNSVQSIGVGAFSGMSALKSLTIPGSVKELSSYTFESCGLTAVTFEEGCEVLPASTISYCYNLVRVNLPSTLTSIGEYSYGDGLGNPFVDCENLAEINLAEGCTAYIVKDNALLSKDETTLLSYPTGAAAEEYTLPANIEQIADGAFSLARNLKQINVEEGADVFSSDEGVLYEDTALHTYPCGKEDTTYTVRDGTTEIYSQAFNGNPYIESVTFPKSLTTIGESAFQECEALASAELPSSLRTIGDSAFFDTGLTEVIVPEKVTFVGIQAFDGCSKLEYMELHMAAANIQNPGFTWSWYDDNLKYIYVPVGQHTAYKEIFAGGNIPSWTMVLEGTKSDATTLKQNIENTLSQSTPSAADIVLASNSLQQMTTAESAEVTDAQIAALDALVETYATELTVTIDAPTDVTASGLAVASGFTEDDSRNQVSLTLTDVTGTNDAKVEAALLELECQYMVNNQSVQPRSPVLITVPCTDAMKAAEGLNVFHVDEGEWTKVPHSISADGASLTFRANHFSNYAITSDTFDPNQTFSFKDAETVLLPAKLNNSVQLIIASYNTDGQMMEYHAFSDLLAGDRIAVEWTDTPVTCRAFLLDANSSPVCSAVSYSSAE